MKKQFEIVYLAKKSKFLTSMLLNLLPNPYRFMKNEKISIKSRRIYSKIYQIRNQYYAL